MKMLFVCLDVSVEPPLEGCASLTVADCSGVLLTHAIALIQTRIL